ncbi:hypothetical protein Hdeb2414_s0016g00474861 [Helianthus debilis subsp. tardiflorus]
MNVLNLCADLCPMCYQCANFQYYVLIVQYYELTFCVDHDMRVNSLEFDHDIGFSNVMV